MGYFKNIDLKNYRNFTNSTFEFNSNCNIIIGNNGSGKTNILEGISLFEIGRGLRKDKIINLVNFKDPDKFFKIESIFINKNNEYKVQACSNEKNLKKLYVNDNSDKDSIKHFQKLFSIIYFLPDMERLFISTPSSRRNFLDRLIFTHNKSYHLLINNYKKSIFERQLFLKNNNTDENWINNIEKNIANFGINIYELRIAHIENINKIVQDLNVQKNFSYNFHLSLIDNFLNKFPNIIINNDQYLYKLNENRKLDCVLGGCSIGPHRSDFSGYKNDNFLEIKQFSTGQQKTVILLIIIAQCIYLIDKLNIRPIVLLDEICSHLDTHNRELILYLVEELKVQVFMTGTEESFFSFLSTKANYCNIT